LVPNSPTLHKQPEDELKILTPPVSPNMYPSMEVKRVKSEVERFDDLINLSGFDMWNSSDNETALDLFPDLSL